MKTHNFVLAGLNIVAGGAGIVLLVQGGQSSKALQATQMIAAGAYDVVGSADMNNDGQINAIDLAYSKGCITSLGISPTGICRGAWQRVSAANPGDGVVKYQKVGMADVNGDGHVTIGDTAFVKGCIGRLPPDNCYGQLARRMVITGRVVDSKGNALGGVDIYAQGADAQGDVYP